MLLAIDTASAVLSCALAKEDVLVAEWTVQRRLTHSEQLIPHIDEMMKEAGVQREDITAVAVSNGPGSFTGLRIGLACAKMLAYIWHIPLITVDTLEALAHNLVGSQAFVLSMEDAQRGNVYAALYASFEDIWKVWGNKVLSIDEAIAESIQHGGPIIAVGESADVYKEKLQKQGILVAYPHQRHCRAGSVAAVAMKKWKRNETSDPLSTIPNYIRRSEAEVQWEKKHKQ